MRFLQQIALVFLFAVTAPASAKTLDYLVPEVLSDSWEYVRIRSWLDVASAGGSPNAQLYHQLPGSGILVESAVINTGVPLNPLQMPMVVNGHSYWVPLQFSNVDNYASLEYRARGIYFIQRGFRMNGDRDLYDRVDISIRLTDANGSPLRSLEYHENAYPSHR